MQNIKLLGINLTLFGGEGGGSGAAPSGDGTSASEGSVGTPKAESNTRNGSSRRSRSGDLSNVIYGKQDDNAASDNGIANPDAEGNEGVGASNTDVSTTSNTLEQRRAEFKKMIEGEYKDIYAENFQSVFDRRFKEVKGMEKSIEAQKPVIDMLMQRYKIGDGDMTKLLTAIEQDDRYWEDAADEAGLTVEQYKAMQKLERENAELKRVRERQRGEQMAQQQLSQWYKDAEAVKEIYPSFDFRAEVANKEFLGLLKSGLPVQKAYELIHLDELKEASARSAAQTAGQQVVARLQNKSSRPAENGTSSQSAAIVKGDVSSLTKADRAEIARRAQRGDIIKF